MPVLTLKELLSCIIFLYPVAGPFWLLCPVAFVNMESCFIMILKQVNSKIKSVFNVISVAFYYVLLTGVGLGCPQSNVASVCIFFFFQSSAARSCLGYRMWIAENCLKGDNLQGTKLSRRGTTQMLPPLHKQRHQCNKSP